MNNSSIYDFHISDLRDKNISGKNNTEVNKLFFKRQYENIGYRDWKWLCFKSNK